MKSVKRAQIFTSYNDDKKLERDVDDFFNDIREIWIFNY